MKNILIATDFSPAARNATDYALRLAKALHGKVTLMSACREIPILTPDPAVILGNTDQREIVQHRLEQEVDNLMSEKPLAIDVRVEEGPTSLAVLEAASDASADLIVVGMTATAKGGRRVFGSTATGLARKSPIPLLVVPETAKFETPVGIALADDVIGDKDREIPAAVRELAEQFNARIFLIRMFNKETGEVIEVLHQSANRLQTIASFSSLAEIQVGSDVAKALEAFIEVHPVSILAMRPKQRSLPAQWLFGSTTRDMIFESTIPLLILPEMKK
ncbi:MAG TPA: universal stress protein [Puia sp.]|nr:universal stress protein [Puia sp.]